MSFYYHYSNIIQTPDNEPLDERWDILNDAPTKPSSPFERCNTFIQYQEYHHDTKSVDDELMLIHQYSPLSSDMSSDFISNYFREEMDNSEIPKIIVQQVEEDDDPDYFGLTNNMEQDDNTSDDDDGDEDDDDVTDETIPLLEQASSPTFHPSDKQIIPQSVSEYHQSLVDYYKSCIMKQQISGNQLVESIHTLSIL